jgi:hypothetical protein
LSYVANVAVLVVGLVTAACCVLSGVLTVLVAYRTPTFVQPRSIPPQHESHRPSPTRSALLVDRLVLGLFIFIEFTARIA